jgi:hypothetical protein
MAMSAITDKFPDVKERFASAGERFPDENTVETGTGAFFLGVGALMAIVSVARGRRGTSAWILPIVLLTGGFALVLTSALQRRSAGIEAAEEAVREELDALDPFARAKVLKEVAQEQLEHYLPEEEEE